MASRVGSSIASVAIIGGGPAGATLGCILAEAGLRVRIYHNEKRPDLVVGESLIPALVPLLRRIGIEETIRARSLLKPGATLYLQPDGLEWNLRFANIEGAPVGYSYNVERTFFDRVVLERAIALGCELVPGLCKVRACAESDTLSLPEDEEPADLIIDATGRRRLFAEQLAIPAVRGARDDVALFAHHSACELPNSGNLHINVLEHGWSWRIPLGSDNETTKVSIGIVAPKTYLDQFGPSAAEQYDAVLGTDSTMTRFCNPSLRISRVAKYSNYQLVSQRMTGANWAMLGDAAGFVDPIFSSGLFISMHSATLLANAIVDDNPESFRNYELAMNREFALWQALIASFYDGRFFQLVRLARSMDQKQIEHLQTGSTVGLLLAGFGYENAELINSYDWVLSFSEKLQRKSSPKPGATSVPKSEKDTLGLRSS